MSPKPYDVYYWARPEQDFGISRVANLVNRTGSGNPELTIRNNQTVFDELTSFAGTWRWNGSWTLLFHVSFPSLCQSVSQSVSWPAKLTYPLVRVCFNSGSCAAPEILADPHNCRYSRATDMFSFGMVLWEIATDGEVPFSSVQFDFEVRDRVVRGERPPLDDQCPEPFATLITKCWSQDPTDRPSATQATARLTVLLASLGTGGRYGAASGRRTENSSRFNNDNSTLASVRGGARSDRDHQHASFGVRVTNLLRARFSGRSSRSAQSDTVNEPFAKYMTPFSNSSPVDEVPMLGHRGGFAATLPSLSESDLGTASSDGSTIFSSSSAESIVSPIVELPIDAMLEGGGESFITDGSRVEGNAHSFGAESSLAARGANQTRGDITRGFGGWSSSEERDDSAYNIDSDPGAYVGSRVKQQRDQQSYFAFV